MSNHRIQGILLISAALLVFPNSLRGQSTGPGTLATATHIKCTFSLIATGSLREEPPKADVKPSSLTLEFEAVNADEGSAQLKGSFGVFDIIVRYAQGYLHFVQSFRDGPLYATTVLEKKTKGGKLKAMHSRHEYTDVSLPGFTSTPEQYYGECEILK